MYMYIIRNRAAQKLIILFSWVIDDNNVDIYNLLSISIFDLKLIYHIYRGLVVGIIGQQRIYS